jgi:hypothetical protein
LLVSHQALVGSSPGSTRGIKKPHQRNRCGLTTINASLPKWGWNRCSMTPPPSSSRTVVNRKLTEGYSSGSSSVVNTFSAVMLDGSRLVGQLNHLLAALRNIRPHNRVLPRIASRIKFASPRIKEEMSRHPGLQSGSRWHFFTTHRVDNSRPEDLFSFCRLGDISRCHDSAIRVTQ